MRRRAAGTGSSQQPAAQRLHPAAAGGAAGAADLARVRAASWHMPIFEILIARSSTIMFFALCGCAWTRQNPLGNRCARFPETFSGSRVQGACAAPACCQCRLLMQLRAAAPRRTCSVHPAFCTLLRLRGVARTCRRLLLTIRGIFGFGAVRPAGSLLPLQSQPSLLLLAAGIEELSAALCLLVVQRHVHHPHSYSLPGWRSYSRRPLSVSGPCRALAAGPRHCPHRHPSMPVLACRSGTTSSRCPCCR